MKTLRVSAVPREGFSDRRRAGEAWPRDPKNPRSVLVVDSEKDPPGRLSSDGLFAIGKTTERLLQADPDLLISEGADTSVVDENAALKAQVAELLAQLAANEKTKSVESKDKDAKDKGNGR